MAIQVSCTCGKTMSVAEQYAGKKGKCGACGAVLDIPTPAVPATHLGEDLTLQAHASAAAAPPTGQRLSECAKCGATATGAGDFCDRCGAPVVGGVAGAAGKLCPECLKLCPANALRCSHCNANLATVTAVGTGQALPRKEHAPVYTSNTPPGMGLGQAIGLVVAAVVLGLLVWGGIAVKNWFKESAYQSHIGGGDDWKAKGYLGDAEREYVKAQEVFPDREEPKQKLKALDDLRKLDENLKRKGVSSGPVGNQVVNKLAEQDRRRQQQEKQMQGESLPPPPARPVAK